MCLGPGIFFGGYWFILLLLLIKVFLHNIGKLNIPEHLFISSTFSNLLAQCYTTLFNICQLCNYVPLFIPDTIICSIHIYTTICYIRCYLYLLSFSLGQSVLPEVFYFYYFFSKSKYLGCFLVIYLLSVALISYFYDVYFSRLSLICHCISIFL